MIITEKWIRTCQECGNKQEDTVPNYGTEPPNAWKFRACKRCKSEALDYGSSVSFNSDGQQLEQVEDEDGNYTWEVVS